MKTRFLTSLIIVVVCFFGCRKEDSITSDPSVKLEFSADSLIFDTVFTSIGSVTQRLKIFNRDTRAVKIARIVLAGGASSDYQININGVATDHLEDIELRGRDSLNLFVKVTINPDSDVLPFIVRDSIVFLTNGNHQKVILSAYGQNAVFLKDAVINTDAVWDNTLPYVIYNTVSVNPQTTLTIKKGARIYFHKNAELIVGGTLRVEGELGDSVTFSSDRLERLYEDEPGQWKGLHFLRSSKDNLINYAFIKNGTTGIRVDSLSESSDPKLILANSIIRTMGLVGLYCDNADVAGLNNVIADCGRNLIYAVNGGKYNFMQNTFVNLGFQLPRTAPSVFFTDQHSLGKTSALNITLLNNIIWGNLQNELIVEKKGTFPFSQVIRKNIIRSKDNTLESLGNIVNADPLFKNARQYNFLLNSDSPAANKGEDVSQDPYYGSWLNKDLNGRLRLFPSDLGSYEIL